jgi:hypothetical protein
MCTCPHCQEKCYAEENGPLPVSCPHCGADLYTEEIEYLDMVSCVPAEIA